MTKYLKLFATGINPFSTFLCCSKVPETDVNGPISVKKLRWIQGKWEKCSLPTGSLTFHSKYFPSYEYTEVDRGIWMRIHTKMPFSLVLALPFSKDLYIQQLFDAHLTHYPLESVFSSLCWHISSGDVSLFPLSLFFAFSATAEGHFRFALCLNKLTGETGKWVNKLFKHHTASIMYEISVFPFLLFNIVHSRRIFLT